jgi:ABC-type nitrate/sulfonate/bicarbonate transport system ATPase subunit
VLADWHVLVALAACALAYGGAVVANIYIPKLAAARPGQSWNLINMTRSFLNACTSLWRNGETRFSLVGTSLFWGAGVTLRFLLVLWVRMAPKARQAKGKARLNSYDKLLNEDVKEKEEKLEIFIPNGPRLGNKVIEAKHVAKAYGDKLLFDDLNFMLPPNGIVGVIGPNGAGKTTLFRLIMGLEKVDKGEFEVGETVKVAYVDQQHKDIDPNKTVYQVISGGNDLIRMGNRDVNARAYLSRFNFSGSDQEKLCGMLSGGERNRLHLAMALKEEGNVLLLDEPTNDIDVNTLRALEGDGFLRIQKSYLVNMAYIKKFNYDRVVLFDGKELSVSQKRYSQMKVQYLSWKNKNWGNAH